MSSPAKPYVPESPAQFHVDVQECLASARAAALPPLGPMPYPEDALELQLLQAARDCADGSLQLPRRELVSVALREAARQQWWRDVAEAEVVSLRRELEAQATAHAAQLGELRHQRKQVMHLLFELVAWAAHQLDCLPSAESVFARVRARGSGYLVHETRAGDADRLRAEVTDAPR